jgi:hypothetical protein
VISRLKPGWTNEFIKMVQEWVVIVRDGVYAAGLLGAGAANESDDK